MSEKVDIEIAAKDSSSAVIRGIVSLLSGDLVTAAAAVGVAFTAAIGISVAVLKNLTDAASDAEQSQARFNALVDSSPLASYKETMQQFADTLSKTTRFEDENILEAEAMLATYQSLGQDVFPQALNATLDLAEFMKTDATGAAETLGRAFSDIAGGSLTMLYRQKLLTQEQKDAAEQMAKTGDAAGAQAFVLDILDGKIGTLAETMGQTFAGRMTILKNTLNNVREELGMKLLPVLQPVIDKFADLAIKYAPVLADIFQNYVVPAVTNLMDAFTGLLDALEKGGLFGLLDAIAAGIKDYDWAGLSDNIVEGINSIDWQGNAEKFTAFTTKLGDALLTAVREVKWGEIGIAIGNAIMSTLAGTMTVNGEQANWQKIKDILKADAEAFPGWSEIGSHIGAKVMQGISMGFKKVGATFQDSMMSIRTTIMNNISIIHASVDSGLSSIVALFLQKAIAMGRQIIIGLASMLGQVLGAVRGFISAVKAAVIPIVIPVSIALPNFGAAAAKIAEGIQDLLRAAGGGGSKTRTGSARRGKAAGGPVEEGETYMVGEEGPELFTPQTSGNIIPNNKLGSGSSFVLNLTYAPVFSTANRDELLSNLRPMLDSWYRQRLTA